MSHNICHIFPDCSVAKEIFNSVHQTHNTSGVTHTEQTHHHNNFQLLIYLTCFYLWTSVLNTERQIFNKICYLVQAGHHRVCLFVRHMQHLGHPWCILNEPNLIIRQKFVTLSLFYIMRNCELHHLACVQISPVNYIKQDCQRTEQSQYC